MASNIKNDLINKDHHSIEDSIPISELLDNGVLVSLNNRICKSYKLVDTNYRLNDMQEKRDILDSYKAMLNSFDDNVEFQYTIFNSKLSKLFMDNNIYFKMTGDKLDYLREAYNQTIRKNIVEDNKAFSKEKIITISTLGINYEKSFKELKVLDEVLNNGIGEIEGARLDPMSASDMLRYLNSIYNIKKKNEYYTKGLFLSKTIDVFTMDNALKQGISAKELVQPSSMEFHNDYMKFGDTYIRGLTLANVNKVIDTEAVDKICSVDFDLLLSYKLRQIDTDEAIKMLENELANIEGDIFNNQRKLAEAGGSADLVPRNMKQRREEAIDQNDAVKIRDEKYFDMLLFVLIFADNLEELNEYTTKFKKEAKGKGIYFITANGLQENVFNSCMPYGLNQTTFQRSIDTEGAVGFVPFSSQDLMQTNGDFFGKNKLTNNPITFDVMSGDNYSGLILGESGKGKSFKAKELTLGRKLRNSERDTIVIDPNNEWGDLVRKLGGEEIYITAGGENHINLFDIDVAYGDNPLADKEDFIISVCKQMLHSPFGLTAGQRTTISQAIADIYEKWIKKKTYENVPTLEDFHATLLKIANVNKAQEDFDLCKAVEFYCGNSQNTLLRGRTNVDTNSSLVSYNLQNLGSDFKPLAMQIILDNIWTHICKNRTRGIPTDILIDEFHLMFRLDSTAEWMFKFWKMLRKYLGCPIGITQNPEDMLSSEFGRSVVMNSSLNILLSLKKQDREIIRDNLNLTNAQIKYITNQPSGEGLLFIQANKSIGANNIVIPFKNPFDKENDIYKLINTTWTKESI